MTSAAPGTSRRTRRTAAINWVTVSCVATASSSTTESNARRVLPVNTPVAATTTRTASKIRSGRSEARSRFRNTVNVVGWKPSWSIGSPQATFQRMSQRSACITSLSDRSCSACNTSTDAITSPGTDGRPFPDGALPGRVRVRGLEHRASP
jgi:hypothetical protein